nr:EOG090X0IV9 [Leptodora kindtii]
MAVRAGRQSEPADSTIANRYLCFLEICLCVLFLCADDFKPASVDTSKMATVDVLPNNEVTVNVPHCDGAGTAQTSVFRGPKKPYAKECVLIIDHSTGEITLEKLSHNIQLKKTRAEGSSKVARPLSPDVVLPSQSYPQSKKASPVRKTPPSPSSSPMARSPPYRSPIEHTLKASPKSISSQATRRTASPHRQQTRASPAPSLPGSMPLIGDLDGVVSTHQEDANSIIGVLSSSSSDSGSDSSSNSSESDSDSDVDETPIPTIAPPAVARNGYSMSSMSAASGAAAKETAPVSNMSLMHLSMPSHLLSEDLRLSESSGSDSD